MNRVAMLKNVLQGKPLKQPLHSALVHFPVGLFVLSLLLDLGSYVRGDGDLLVRGAFYAMVFGIVMAVVAAVPGLIDWSDIRPDHPGSRTATYHMLLNLLAVGLYAVNVGLRIGTLEASSTPAGQVLLSVIAIGILSVSGYLGGKLIYELGVGVGRHRRQGDSPPETFRAAPDEAGGTDGFVAVADADCLPVGRTIRAEVDGHVMAITNLDGSLYAYQDFCTHRFAPLSDGALEEGQVRCPWHNSCFDVRTGRVVEGPAKVDLKSYRVEVRDGKIQVRVG